MRIYLACVGMMVNTYPEILRPRFIEPEPSIAELRSYWELKWFDGHTLPAFGKPFFLDSGAFSAYSQNKPIDVQDYIDFVKRYEHQLDVYANLDEIPKEFTVEGRSQAARITLENQKIMEDAGLKPIPVFHKDEPWEYLEMYMEKYEYICLGGLVDSGELGDFLDKVWADYLTDPQGNPKLKVHGFGMTALRSLTAHPWYSVDSSTWLVHSKYGMMTIPQKTESGYDYSKAPILVAVSDDSSYTGQRGRHYDTMTRIQQAEIREYLNQFGLTIEQLRGHPGYRFVINLHYWQEVERSGCLATKFRKPRQLDLL